MDRNTTQKSFQQKENTSEKTSSFSFMGKIHSVLSKVVLFARKTKSHIYRNHIKYTTLGFLSIVGALTGGTCQYIKNQEISSTAIGKKMGEQVVKKQQRVNSLNQVTQTASLNRSTYQHACYQMSHIINRLFQEQPEMPPQKMIDEACAIFNTECINKNQKDVIIEDMQAIKHFFPGTTKELRNMMCYYHLSPEVPFHNRYSEQFRVNNAIGAYEIKARRYLYQKDGILRKSMLELERNR